MPIRFRCAYCNQLMGIARRKAGGVVRCPKCAGEVIVPHPEDSSADNPVEVRDSGLFEQSNFDEIFHDAAGDEKPASVKIKNTPAGAAAEPKALDDKPSEFRQQELPSPAALPGILLSPSMATLLTVAVVVALALAFAGGLVVGLYLKTPPAGTTHFRATPDSARLA